jgi:hypothetical protein
MKNQQQVVKQNPEGLQNLSTEELLQVDGGYRPFPDPPPFPPCWPISKEIREIFRKIKNHQGGGGGGRMTVR